MRSPLRSHQSAPTPVPAGVVRYPLRCTFCGQTWIGTAAGIGLHCPSNPLAGSSDVVQCDPAELFGREEFRDGF